MAAQLSEEDLSYVGVCCSEPLNWAPSSKEELKRFLELQTLQYAYTFWNSICEPSEVLRIDFKNFSIESQSNKVMVDVDGCLEYVQTTPREDDEEWRFIFPEVLIPLSIPFLCEINENRRSPEVIRRVGRNLQKVHMFVAVLCAMNSKIFEDELEAAQIRFTVMYSRPPWYVTKILQHFVATTFTLIVQCLELHFFSHCPDIPAGIFLHDVNFRRHMIRCLLTHFVLVLCVHRSEPRTINQKFDKAQKFLVSEVLASLAQTFSGKLINIVQPYLALTMIHFTLATIKYCIPLP